MVKILLLFTGTIFLISSVFASETKESRHKIIDGTVVLQQDEEWIVDSLVFLPGAVLQTDGHNFKLVIHRKLFVTEDAKIQSFNMVKNENTNYPPPKPTRGVSGSTGANGSSATKGQSGGAGAPGMVGKTGGSVAISLL